jgi:D-glycero-D-manno-heptose 1,7-bisphosphate phosphatase
MTKEHNTMDEQLKKVLFVDLDGTIRHGKDELGFFGTKPEHVIIYEGVPQILRAYREDGWLIAGIINQGGVALGHLTTQDVLDMNRRTMELCEDEFRVFDLIHFCEDHPDASRGKILGGANMLRHNNHCWFRKPSPGMIYEAIFRLGQCYLLSPSAECLFVGDRTEDAECARRADVPFMDAKEWRDGGWQKSLLNKNPGLRIKTWPYGTRRKAKVGRVFRKLNGASSDNDAVTLVDEFGEGHMIVGHPEIEVAPNEDVILEFTKGGPTGGYWKIIRL